MFCSIKMRASRTEEGRTYHISGAERLLDSGSIPDCAKDFLLRAQRHSKGEPEQINLRVEVLDPKQALHIQPLPVRTVNAKSLDEGRSRALEYLALAGIRSENIFHLLEQCAGMRGAILVDHKSFERLDVRLGRDSERGIRVTYMDWKGGGGNWKEKRHFAEALVLASKVANAPGIVAELCISDDPDYVTGYVASRLFGYVRISPLKKSGDPFGGRIFFLDMEHADLESCVAFLEKKVVLVDNVRDARDGTEHWFADRLEVLRKEHLLRTCSPVHGPQNRTISYGQKDCVHLASNDYLALANHPAVKAAGIAALEQYGAGTGGSRLICGTLPLHTELEKELAAFFGKEAGIVFGTGYQANCGTIQALCGKGDVIFSDALNHASIIDGCRLSGAHVVVYAHNDMADLEARAQVYAGRRGLIVSDSVFSMDGDILKLPDFLAIARRYGFLSMIDEAHATGVLGEGRGTAAYFGLKEGADVTVGTMSKALGSEGGFVVGSSNLIALLRNCSRSFIFSTAPSASVVASALAALRILDNEPWRPARLHENIEYFSTFFGKHHETSIFPIIIGDEVSAQNAAALLRDRGFFLQAIRYPSVARGQARLRVTLRADHTKEDLRSAALNIIEIVRSV